MGLEALADVQVVRPSLCTYVRAFVGEAIFRLACRRFLLFYIILLVHALNETG